MQLAEPLGNFPKLFSISIFTILVGGSATKTKALKMHKILSAKQATIFTLSLRPSLPVNCYQ